MVIVEATVTHVGNPKPLNFPDKYKDNDKIIYLITEEDVYKDCKTAYDREAVQRNYPLKVIPIANDDIVISTDIDEIINSEMIEQIVYETRSRDLVRLGMRLFYYYIDVVVDGYLWKHPYACTGKVLKQSNDWWHPTNLNNLIRQAPGNNIDFNRAFSFQTGYVLPNCGNHFTYMGGYENLLYKIQNYSHTDYNTPELMSGLKNRMENLEDIIGRTDQPNKTVIDIDELHPKTIRENISEWQKYMYNKEK
jgi:hypothetical protein